MSKQAHELKKEKDERARTQKYQKPPIYWSPPPTRSTDLLHVGGLGGACGLDLGNGDKEREKRKKTTLVCADLLTLKHTTKWSSIICMASSSNIGQCHWTTSTILSKRHRQDEFLISLYHWPSWQMCCRSEAICSRHLRAIATKCFWRTVRFKYLKNRRFWTGKCWAAILASWDSRGITLTSH